MLRKIQDGDLRYDALMFWCPGCAENDGSGLHILPVSGETGARSRWDFDGNFEFPTLNPSILTKMTNFVCHSFLRNGVFEFLGDCTHSMAGHQVPIGELPEWVIRDD